MYGAKFIVISDNPVTIHQAKQFAVSIGAECEVYSSYEWKQKQTQDVPALSSGTTLFGGQQMAKVLPFPGSMNNNNGSNNPSQAPVKSINDMEANAIRNAIHAYRGNLTEASKALGIGRATLYRKVKQYDIDLTEARSKKRAA